MKIIYVDESIKISSVDNRVLFYDKIWCLYVKDASSREIITIKDGLPPGHKYDNKSSSVLNIGKCTDKAFISSVKH